MAPHIACPQSLLQILLRGRPETKLNQKHIALSRRCKPGFNDFLNRQGVAKTPSAFAAASPTVTVLTTGDNYPLRFSYANPITQSHAAPGWSRQRQSLPS